MVFTQKNERILKPKAQHFKQNIDHFLPLIVGKRVENIKTKGNATNIKPIKISAA